MNAALGSVYATSWYPYSVMQNALLLTSTILLLVTNKKIHVNYGSNCHFTILSFCYCRLLYV